MPIDFEGLKNNDNTYGNNRSSNFNRWKPSAGDNVVRILPPSMLYFEEDINFFTHVFNNHFVSLGKGNFEVFRCLRDDPSNPKCPACTFFFKYRKDTDENIANMASRFGTSVRHIMNVLVIETEDSDNAPEGIQVYECGPGVYDDIKLYAANKRYGDIFDLEEGRNMIIHLTPGNEHKTGRNQYNVNPDLDTSNIRHLLDEGWEDKIDALESQIPDYPDLDYVHQVIQTAADMVDLELTGIKRGKVRATTPVSEPVAEDTDEAIQLDDDDEIGDDFDGLLDDDDLDF